MRKGCTLVPLALNPVKLLEELCCFGWITWTWEECTEIGLLTVTFLYGGIPHPWADSCLWHSMRFQDG